MRHCTKQDWVLGALFRIRLRIGKDATISLMQSRAGMPEKTARQLAFHWFSYRGA